MNLIINGKNEIVDAGVSEINVVELLRVKNVEMPDMVSVELNEVMLSRVDFEKTLVREGDKVEFLYFMGGGSPEPRETRRVS